jgi:hypothetical protein
MSYTILEEEAKDNKPENDDYSIKIQLISRDRHYTAKRLPCIISPEQEKKCK